LFFIEFGRKMGAEISYYTLFITLKGVKGLKETKMFIYHFSNLKRMFKSN